MEIDKTFQCPYHGCTKTFGSEGSQNLHIKIKHNGGTKTERERLAGLLCEAYKRLNEDGTQIPQDIIDQIDVNLPPGIITSTAQKSGLFTVEELDNFDENGLLSDINLRLAPKFREMICGEAK